MNDNQNKILKLLWQFNSLREEHIIKICKCTSNDIDLLISKKRLERERGNNIIKYRAKEINSRNIAAFDVVMEYLDRDPEIQKGKRPVNVTMKTKYTTYDIIAVKEDEVDNLFQNIDSISSADKVIIIIQTQNFVMKEINTKRECCICTFPPIEIVYM